MNNRISTEAEAQARFAERHLIKTMDKARFIKRLRDIRRDCIDPVEADLLHELIAEVDSGSYDG